MGYCRALGPPTRPEPGRASLGSQPHVQPGPERARPGRQASGPPAHPCEPGLPIVNIYLTPVTSRMTQMSSTSTTRLASLPPPPAPGRGHAAASLPSGRGAPGCGRARQPTWCGRCGRCALRAALLLPGGRPDALQINAVAFLESERGRARRTQTPPVTVAIPCAPHHICLPQQQQQRGAEGGSEAGGGGAELGARRAPRRSLRLPGVRHPGLLAPRLAVRGDCRGSARLGGRSLDERLWASGRGHSGTAREAAPRPGPLAPPAGTDRRKFYLQLGARGGWWDSPALCSVSANGRAGSAGGLESGWLGPASGWYC